MVGLYGYHPVWVWGLGPGLDLGETGLGRLSKSAGNGDHDGAMGGCLGREDMVCIEQKLMQCICL